MRACLLPIFMIEYARELFDLLWGNDMKKVLTYLRGYRLQSILGPLFKLLEACFELAVPFVIASIIDTGIPEADASFIVRRGLLLVGLGVIGLICSVTAQYFAAKAAVGLASNVRHALFEHIQRFSYSDLDSVGASTLITRLTSDINQVQTGVNLALRLFLRSPFIVFGAMIMAFTIDAKCGVVFAVAIPILMAVVFGIMLVTMPIYRRTQARLDDVTALTRENLSGVRVLRAYGREDDEINDFEKRHGALTRFQLLAGRVSALMNPLTCILLNFALIWLIRTGAVRVSIGALSQGQVVALINYMSQILVELIKFADLIITVSKSAACGSRIGAILAMRPEMPPVRRPEAANPDDDGCVDFDQVSLKYRSAGADALTDIDLHVRRGQMIGIIGGTGVGKTSLANLIPRFYDATKGCVRVGGVDVRRRNPEELRARIGIVPQKALLFRGTIRDNLKWGDPDASDDELMEAVCTAQAEDVLEAKGGLDAEIEQGGRNLSGGQRQRLAIARALVRKPEILILDDCASALDYATDARLRMALRQLSYRPTVFVISQRVSAVRFSDRILVLDDGHAVAVGTHDELLRVCGVYRDICASQLGKEVSA